MLRLSLADLESKRADGTYLDYMKSQMKDFCFTINRHIDKERTWFGSHTLTINRNIAFNFFDRDVAEDDGLEPFPVIRSEATRTVEIRVKPYEDDGAAMYTVVAFYLDRKTYEESLRSMEALLDECGDLRTLPDAWFPETPIIKLAKTMLAHAKVAPDRQADWPDLLT